MNKPPLKTKAGKRKRQNPRTTRANRAANMRKVRLSQESNLTVTLRMEHFVNGRVFGPGKITVLRSLGQQFLKEEEAQIEQQRNLFIPADDREWPRFSNSSAKDTFSFISSKTLIV